MRNYDLSTLLIILTVSLCTSAFAVEKECKYKIFVKSNKEGINSTYLPNGLLISKGRYKGSKKKARGQAAEAARRCLDHAHAGNNIPNNCKSRDLKSSSDGYVKLYNIPKLRSVAFNTACKEARALGNTSNKLKGIMIYAFNEAKDDCNINDDKYDEYYIIANGLATKCSGGMSAGEIPTGINRFTGWYDENALQIKKRIKRACKKNFNKKNYKIDYFQIKSDTGKIRAKFSCI